MGVLVSIIVPVYNVEAYIEQCLTSLVSQTYNNIEIIVINDGSTDHSGDICEKWRERRDLIYISKKNEGLGATRNQGIKVARGSYILFVDSDDWLAPNAVASMIACIGQEEKPDVIALSRYYEFNDQTKKGREIRQNEWIGVESICSEEQRRMYLLYGFVVTWGKLFRKKFLLENEIWMPSIPHEDNAVFAEIIFRANKVQFCDKPLYYYRVGRTGNILSNYTHFMYMPDACENFLKYFITHNILSLHYPAIKHYVETRLAWSYEMFCQYKSDISQQRNISEKFKMFYDQYFKNQKFYGEYKFGLLGSFGSRWVIHSLGVNKEQLVYHCPFSSIIAQMAQGKNNNYRLYNKNVFRKEKIKNDIEGKLPNMLSDEKEYMDFFFIDFLEERYDVAELVDGNYITLSEAFMDSDIEDMEIQRIVKAGSEEHFSIWRKKCIELVALLKRKFKYKQIILIKSRLAIKYQVGEENMAYAGQTDLIKKNEMISKMENFFLELMGNRVQIYAYPDFIYTEKDFRMGMEPQYLGDSFYGKMKAQISVSFDCVEIWNRR